MKFNNLRAFEKHLQGSAPIHFSSLYFILGKDSFLRKSAIELLLKAQKTYDVQTLDGKNLSKKKILTELDAFNLFSERRLILIEEADKLDKDAMVALETYFEKPNRSICLIFSAVSLHHGAHFYRKGEKAGIVLEFVEEKPWEKERSIQEWMSAFVESQGKGMDGGALKLLMKFLGTDQELIKREVEKLICYVGTRSQITSQDITAIVSPVASETVWQLGEAIFRRDAQTSLCICKSLLLADTSLFLLMRQLRAQFQTGLHICSIVSEGKGREGIVQKFPYMKGVLLERHIEQAQSYGIKAFKRGLLEIDAVELQAKNSNMEADFLAELLIIKLIYGK